MKNYSYYISKHNKIIYNIKCHPCLVFLQRLFFMFGEGMKQTGLNIWREARPSVVAYWTADLCQKSPEFSATNYSKKGLPDSRHKLSARMNFYFIVRKWFILEYVIHSNTIVSNTKYTKVSFNLETIGIL